jgi:hypothetical protein
MYDAYHVLEDGVIVDIWPVIPRGPGHHGLAAGMSKSEVMKKAFGSTKTCMKWNSSNFSELQIEPTHCGGSGAR